MHNITYTLHIPPHLDLTPAAHLFSTHYALYSPSRSSPSKRGKRIAMSPTFLKHCLFGSADPENILHATAHMEGELIGSAFASLWSTELRGKEGGEVGVCWVTQLVVHQTYRRRGIATALLREVRDEAFRRRRKNQEESGEDGKRILFGIASSHPFSIAAAARAFGCGLDSVDLDLIGAVAPSILAACPVEYLRNGKLKGIVFEEDEGKVDECEGEGNGAGMEATKCVIDTGFFVDHEEPLEALRVLREQGRRWVFGGLSEGCECLLIVDGTPVGEAVE